MRAPAMPNVFLSDESTPTIISACSFSLPACAPSSQSQVMSKSRPIFACSSSAFTMSFSLPAKCSQAGITGKGFSPAKRASRGWVAIAGLVLEVMRARGEDSILGALPPRNEHRIVEIEHDGGALLTRLGKLRERNVLRAYHPEPHRPDVLPAGDLLPPEDDMPAPQGVAGEGGVGVGTRVDGRDG